jgi:large subunit ribosomal protein L1
VQQDQWGSNQSKRSIMGKIRVKVIGDEEAELKQLEELKKKKEARIARLQSTEAIADGGQAEAKHQAKAAEEEVTGEPSSAPVENGASEGQEKKQTKKEFKKTTSQKKPHSKAYFSAKEKVDSKKIYSVSEGIELLKTLQRAKFDETVELHIATVEQGVSGHVTFPHGTGKKMRVAIATDELIEQIEKGLPASADAQASSRRGKIDFDILVAEPAMMPKLAKVAKILGPKGLMPNPKNGTITANPQELVKKYEGGQINFKTEAKAPIIHLTIGKASFEDKKLADNIKAIFTAVKKDKISSVVLKSTMSPAIRIQA